MIDDTENPRPRAWRSLEELSDTPAFRELLEREFPQQASEWDDPLGRRRFLQLMGASLALAGLTACSRPFSEKIVPYVRQPEDLVPGKPLFYATAIRLASASLPVLVTSTMGRPIKIEGNPDHPESLGATDVFTQAAILGLYDPDRSRTVLNLGAIRPYSDLLGVVRDAVEAQGATRGAGLRILTGAISSPTLAWQISDLLHRFPLARWHRHEAVDEDNVHAGARMAFGETLETRLHLDDADVVLSLDADFLAAGPGQLRNVREFVRRRRVPPHPDLATGANAQTMNRLYVAESMPSLTGAMADHRFRMRSSDVPLLARAVAAALEVPGVERGRDVPRLAEADLAATLGVAGA
ncbi:MAG TPA: TAT-variant-translocated molybdopterin oxidoreductase, partial [Candidatus Polarisedimenticolia bacterium]|nr:TAT-variant-translocated molybdopterin oxidoreductase [Candidatus Polarisedimenticolia bacterium]